MSEEADQREILENDDDILGKCGPIDIPPAPLPVQALDSTGPRLMITKIVAKNFKSYGGVREMGPFHKNFTCVIGPNGSGKSNVIDSMLFVFGYRAAKVRSKKLCQLIHNSEIIPQAASCSVAVHFQKIIDHGSGADDYEVVPQSCFVVSRSAFRDNSSSYWINDSRVVYRDVANLLRLHGIDLDHNRFLILQGEVEQIALMKPKAPSEHEDGFLEYLEDIIGSSRFKTPLATYTDRIERLNDMRLEKLTRVKAVESEKDELEGVRNEAVGHLRLVNQIARMKNILFQQNLAKERGLEADARQRLDLANQECQTLAGQIEENTREVDRLTGEKDKLVARQTELQHMHREAKAKFSQCEADDSRLRDEHAHTKVAGKRLAKALQTERRRLEELQRLPEEAETRRAAINNQLTELDATRRRHEEEYQVTVDSLAKETAPLRTKVEAAEEVLGPLQAEADSVTSQLRLEAQRFDLAMAGQRREAERASAAQNGVETAKRRLAERLAELAAAREALKPEQGAQQRRRSSSSGGGGILGGLAAANRNLAEVKQKEVELAESLRELRSKLAESKSTLQSDTCRDRVLSVLLEAQQNGSLPGIRGRLGSLAVVPPRYDVAISTACSALDNIVTDTMETAQKAVVLLKLKNLGQATFIALDKMQKWESRCRASFQVPRSPVSGCQVERLYDAIQFVEEDLRPAFYFALRDTLVTDTLDAATKIAFGQGSQRHRVVTLQGQLIETSGAMSGGGGRPSSGRMVTSLRQVQDSRVAAGSRCIPRSSLNNTSKTSNNGNEAVDLADLERQLASGDATLASLREKRAHLEEVITRLTRRREEAERTVTRCETECCRLQTEIETLTGEAVNAQTRAQSMGPSSGEQAKMQSSIAKLEALVKKKTEAAEKKRSEVNRLKEELMDVGSARLTAVRSRLEAIERKTKETTEQLTKLEVSLKTTARNVIKAESKVANMETELEAAKSKLSEIEAKLTDLEELGRSCLAEFQKIRTEGDELQGSIVDAQKLITSAQQARETAQKSEVALRRSIAQLEAEFSQAVQRARQLQRDLRGLRLHRIEDEENDGDGVEKGGAVEGQRSPPVGGQHQGKELPTYSGDQLKELTVDQQEMHRLEQQVAGMAPNMAAIEEYRRKVETYLSRVGELNQVTTVLGEQRRLMEEARTKRLSEFLDGFQAITSKLKEMYQMITQGGDAELELIDSLDPFSEGIVFSVRPPKKSWKNIANLSGGEKTLSSLALVFALHHYKPTPLYVMDEIDAALDFKNVSIVGNYLKERTKNAQFIVISLRNNMFELSDRLVGIYKTYNITKTITLDPVLMADQLDRLLFRVATIQGREKEYHQYRLRQQQQQQNQHEQQQRVQCMAVAAVPVASSQALTSEDQAALGPSATEPRVTATAEGQGEEAEMDHEVTIIEDNEEAPPSAEAEDVEMVSIPSESLEAVQQQPGES